MRSIEKSIVVQNKPVDVFSSLITPSRINDWWKSTTAIVNPKLGGIWMASWGEDCDDPDYITSAVMTAFELNSLIVMSNYDYMSKNGPLPFDADFETSFTINELDNHQTELKVIQSGFPDDEAADDFFAGCTKGWEDTLSNLKSHLKKSE